MFSISPKTFNKLASFLLPVSAVFTVILILSGLYYAFFASPEDYQQGQTVRIMYVHVPSAWMSLFAYSVVFFSAISFLAWKNPLSDLFLESSAKLGACFTLITLVTGSLWGKPMWGTWWVWDARLTSVLILFFLYIGLIALRSAHENSERGKKLVAILAIVGFINIPIIKFSVEWWNTLHQPASVIKIGGPSIHTSMLTPLLLMFFGFMCYYAVVLLLQVKTSLHIQKNNRALHKKKH